MRKIFLLFVLIAYAAAALAYDNTYALIIGVADYKNFSTNSGDLRYTTSDARRFAAFLRSKKGGSVPAGNIVLLTDAQASKANIISKGKALFSKAKKNDRVIFYFSGHGDRGCFVPYDAGDSWESWLYFSEVKDIFRHAKCNTKLLFADACFSGSMKGLKTKAFKQAMDNEKKASSNMNIAVMMSCQGNETSLEMGNLKQSLFTYYLMQGLGGSANRDNNKYVTIQELYYYVYKKTRNKAAAIGHSQTPELFGKFDLRLIVAKI